MTLPTRYDARRRVITEVLELGETLFDSVLDAAAARSGAEQSEPFPEVELRTAFTEFFQTLRVLLGLREDSASDDSVP